MAETKSVSILISERIGKVSGIVMLPKGCKILIVLAHGAGAGMTHHFMEEVSVALYENKIGTLRYQFPYMEKGSRRPDPPAIAEKTVGMVLEYAHAEYPQLNIFAGGKSFGGRMTSQYASKHETSFLKGIIFFGFPLHAIGNPSIDRAAHLNQVKVPLLFLQGTKDKLAEISLIKKVVRQLKTASIEIFENADHSFKVPKKNIVPELVDAASAWMLKLIK